MDMSTTMEQVIDKDLQKRLIFAWLAAMRSGKWRQTRRYLEDDNGNCCLGVAIRVLEAVRPGTVVIRQVVGSTTRLFIIDGDVKTGVLPLQAQHYFGLRHEDGAAVIGDTRIALTLCNDAGRTFPEIADIIEANARDLFVNGEEVETWIKERNAGRGA